MLALRYRRTWIAGGVLLGAAIVVGSLLPGHVVPPLATGDKVLHSIAYGTLTLWFVGLLERPRYFLAGLASFALGVVVELAQATLTATRLAESGDLIANGTGAAVGLVLAYAGLGGWARQFERWLGVAPPVER